MYSQRFLAVYQRWKQGGSTSENRMAGPLFRRNALYSGLLTLGARRSHIRGLLRWGELRRGLTRSRVA